MIQFSNHFLGDILALKNFIYDFHKEIAGISKFYNYNLYFKGKYTNTKILNSMIENCKKYLIQGSKIHSKTLNLYTVESNISLKLKLIQNKNKKFVNIGSYPFFRLGKIGVSIVTRSTSLVKLKKVNKDLIKMVKSKEIQVLKI